MPPALRSVLAVLAGVVVFMVTVMLVEVVSATLFPPPPGLDLSKPEDMKRLMETIPLAAKLLVMAGWAAGTFAGGWVSARLAGRTPLGHAGAIGVLGVVGAVATMLMIPHPLWMWIVGLTVFPAAACLAGLAARRKGPAVVVPEGTPA